MMSPPSTAPPPAIQTETDEQSSGRQGLSGWLILIVTGSSGRRHHRTEAQDGSAATRRCDPGEDIYLSDRCANEASRSSGSIRAPKRQD